MMSLKQKAMLERAKMEAQRMGNDYVGSEHLLLALLHQNEGCLAKGLAMGLEFKLGSEILRTVVVREFSEIATVAAIIALRAALTFLIHWEIKVEKESEK